MGGLLRAVPAFDGPGFALSINPPVIAGGTLNSQSLMTHTMYLYDLRSKLLV